MNNYGDKDYYKINLSQSSMPFCFTHDTINSSSTYWSIKILKYNSGTYDEVFSKTLYMNDTAGQLTTITSSGTYYVCISTSSYYNTTGCDYNILIGAPDTTKPTGSISSTNKLATSQTVTLTLSDNVGIAGHYWGTSSNYSSNNFYQTSSKSVIDTVSSSGTYYLTVKDTSGNLSSTVSKTFYKTTLNANSGSVTPSYIITMNGNSFTFPTPSKSGSSYNGWSTSSSATSGVKTLTPTSNTTYYAVWKQDQTEVVPTSVTLSKTTLSLNIGKSEILTATVIPSNATNKTKRMSIKAKTIASYCYRNGLTDSNIDSISECCYCHEKIEQKAKGKKRLFCNDKCRSAWRRAHHMLIEPVYHHVCAGCGTAFKTAGNKSQKYCSRQCYLNHRKGSVV